MHLIVDKSQLSPNVTRLVVEAPRIAEIRQPGQFVIVRRGPGAERIPLTIAAAGRPTELISEGHAVCVVGGVGTAVILPIALELARRGVRVTSVIGGRSREWVILEPELREAGDVVVCTDDGS